MLQSLIDRAAAARSPGSASAYLGATTADTNPYRHGFASASTPLHSAPPAYSFDNPHKSAGSSASAARPGSDFVPDGRYFRGGAEPRETDVFIAVMGVTGSGKSTFISHCTKREVQIGHSLRACTQTVTAYLCKYSADVNVYLIDTPGFDDTEKSDLDVLKDIATWLTDSFRKSIRINGILYLHRITDSRMQGSAVRSLGMFKKLCGVDALKNVILVTTMWEKVNASEGEARVQELTSTEDFWGCMIASGSRVERHTNDRDSALRLVRALLNQQGIPLKMQEEMVKDGKSLDETAAGIELDGILAKERAKWQRQLEETQAQYSEALKAKDGVWTAMLEKQKAELSKKMNEADRKREEMRVSMEAMHKERYEKLLQQFETLKLQASQGSQGPRIRSHPGRNRILEFRSFALMDKSYCFCGPATCDSSLPPNIKSQITIANAQNSLRLVAMGVNGNYWIHYHDGSKCKDITHLPNYLSLENALRVNPTLGCPKTVSLGVNGKFFVSFQHSDKKLYNLPTEAVAALDFDIGKVKAAWLGAKDTFVVMRTDRQVRWSSNLSNQSSGLYPGLADQIMASMDTEPRIKALALNLTNPKCYAMAWRNGRVHYNSEGVFEGFKFEEFATKNFGTTFL